MSNDLYDMLCGHEVGHALYTPDWSKEKDSIVKKVPHSYLNVLEDIRIDRKIKQKYPGLKSSYFKGQGELRDRGFFGTKDRPLNTFKFIDRINIYSKNGSVEPVPFSDEEKILLDRALKTETFDDVVNLAIDIAGYAKEEKTPEWENQSDDFQEGNLDDDMENKKAVVVIMTIKSKMRKILPHLSLVKMTQAKKKLNKKKKQVQDQKVVTHQTHLKLK